MKENTDAEAIKKVSDEAVNHLLKEVNKLLVAMME